MKFAAIVVLATVGLASAWNLNLHSARGDRVTRLSGRRDSGCREIDDDNRHGLRVDRAEFRTGRHGSVDEAEIEADGQRRFELFDDDRCRHRVFSEGRGDHRIRPAVTVRAYRVY